MDLSISDELINIALILNYSVPHHYPMDESFAITKYDSQHINVLTGSHVLPRIESGLLSPELILNRAGATSPHELLKNWSESLSPENEQSELYPLPEWAEWQDIPHSIKMARLASILGLHISSRYGEITPEMIAKVLASYESKKVELGVVDFTEMVVSDWNTVFNIDSNARAAPINLVDRFVFLRQSRITELNDGKDSFCAITKDGEALIPIDSTHAPLASNSFYSAVAHELTHLVRHNSLDNVYLKGKSLKVDPLGAALKLHIASTWVVEGIAQLATNIMAKKFDRMSSLNKTTYLVETFAIEILQIAFGIPDHQLVSMPISALVELLNKAHEPNSPHYHTVFDEVTDDIEHLQLIYAGKNRRPANLREEMDKFIDKWYPVFLSPSHF